jgi:DNA-binding response OmpR family regulator
MQYVFSAMQYDVVTYSEPTFCPLYTKSANACTKDHPCADLMITDFLLPRMNGLDLIAEQAAHDCKVTPRNKAVMSARLDEDQIRSIAELGSAYLEKPVELDDLAAWVSVCEKRINTAQPLANRRDAMRYSDDRKIRCLIGKDDLIMNADAINVSDSGLCLRLPANLEKGQIVRFVKDPILSSQYAIVRWVSTQGNGVYLAGLRYC